MSSSARSSSPSGGEASPQKERFGDYVIERELASGGMATVYEAVELVGASAPRRLALKRIHPHLARDPAFVDMFLDEARIAARIHHPHVCPVLGYGREGGVSFLTMELLRGRPLSQLLSALARHAPEGSEHVRFVSTLLLEAASGLHAAHELRGEDGQLLEVVHRDVSPQNLFCTFEGTVRVLDFGVASARDKLHRTETGAVKGKLGYLAPEQIAGKVDRRADVWALGVVLWEVLALKRLFRRGTPSETILAVERDPISPPSSARPGLTTALDAVVLAALERDRERRIADARAFEQALLEALTPLGGPLPSSERAAWVQRLFADAPRSREEEVTLAQVFPPEFSPILALAESAEDASDELDASGARRQRSGSTAQPGSPATSEPSAPSKRRGALGWWVLLPLALAALAVAAPLLGPSATPLGAAPREAASETPTPAASPAATEPAIEATPIDTTPVDTTPDETPIEATPPASIEARPGPRPATPRVEPVRDPALAPSDPVPEPPIDPTPGRVTVPLGVAVCFDRPCSDRGAAIFGPRSLMLAGGEHRVHYIEVEGPSEGPATSLGSSTVSVRSGTTTTVPRP